MGQRKSIVEALKEAIEGSDLDRKRLCKKSEVDEAQISRFLNDKRTLTLESAERIAKVLKLELKPKKKKAR